MWNFLKKTHKPRLMAFEFLRYIGPGFLVTVGFIDPGNWASNVSAGSYYGYELLWIITLSTVMLIILQHNAAHLGISTGYCLSEATAMYINPVVARVILASAMLAAVSTALAEIVGAGIALHMLFGLPVKVGAVMVVALVSWLLYSNSYKKIERLIIGFVSLIGISFVFELSLVHIDWNKAALSWVMPRVPSGALPIVMSLMGAVVMPHNMYLHSEVIQSRQWNLKDEETIRHQLKYEFMDTLFSMVAGWAINSAMILLAASTFFARGVKVTALDQAQETLRPLLGDMALVVFALALLLSGISSSVTAGMAGGSIFAGLYREPYNIYDRHTKVGVGITFALAAAVAFLIKNPFSGLIVSQLFLSVQLPLTVFTQIYLTSSQRVMGKYANSALDKILLWTVGSIVTYFNVMLLIDTLRSLFV
ncbi:Nramp family divalent metal transporter [Caldanaerobius polysaccharolyticus]|nr:Nramp family divalent metal transporter [Caldanaerobius polysaccharolyticus]